MMTMLKDGPINHHRLHVCVDGDPKGQPRPRAFARKFGKKWSARMYDLGTAENWKNIVAAEVKKHHIGDPILRGVAVTLDLVFLMRRPKAHFRTGRNTGTMKTTAPLAHTVKPDLDNLEKAILDCLKDAGFFHDDSQVSAKVGEKRYVLGNERPGLRREARWDA